MGQPLGHPRQSPKAKPLICKPRRWTGKVAGVLGFEPRNGGTKNRCLTTWRYPNTVGGYLAKPTAPRKRKIVENRCSFLPLRAGLGDGQL